ncbi:MAG: hypothetical protein IPN68_18695 [Bacteroidetes bacterium]|nr:hypothetical protein [Bacteroidota bacterium]
MEDYFLKEYPDIKSSDKNKAINAFNQFCSPYENIMARYIFDSGTTWPGILFHSDRVSVDYCSHVLRLILQESGVSASR